MKKVSLMLGILTLFSIQAFAEGGSGGGGSPCIDGRKYQCLRMAEEYFEKEANFPDFIITELAPDDGSSCANATQNSELNLFTFKLVSKTNPEFVQYWGADVVTTRTRPCSVLSMRTYERK